MGKKRPATIEGQLTLFPELEEKPAVKASLGYAHRPEQVQSWGQRWPEGLWVGTSSWSFPGWSGLLYDRSYSESKLSQQGLTAYSRHPLLRAVGLDRTYYASMSSDEHRHYAEQVPEGFRFLVKAPERLTLKAFSRHPRHGALAGCDNPDFLNAQLACQEWIEPACQGLGRKLGCLLLQFSPMSLAPLGGSKGFAVALHRFLEQLPTGPVYAIEIRNRELLSLAYLQVLERLGACHCLTVHPKMPSLLQQYEMSSAIGQPMMVIRWMLGSPRIQAEEWNYQAAVERYQPFNRMVDEDLDSRRQILTLWRRALEQQQQVMTIVNNKAEGCSPLSIERLAEDWFDSPAFGKTS